VQKERDRLGKQRGHNHSYGMGNIKVNSHISSDRHEEIDDDDDLSVTALLRAEKTAQEVFELKEFLLSYDYESLVII
jgi:hypothetical protein